MKEKNFFDIYYQPSDKPVFCYRSKNMVYEEVLDNGCLVSAGYNTAGYPLNLLGFCPSRLNTDDFTEPFAFNIEIDGQSIDYGLKFIDFKKEQTDDFLKCELILESEIKPVRIKVCTLLDGTQMLTRHLEIENLSEKPFKLSRLSLLSGGIEETELSRYTTTPDKNNIYSVGYFDSEQWDYEGGFSWHPLDNGSFSIDKCFNRDRFRHPLVFIRNNLNGNMWFSQIGWSAGCRFTIDCNTPFNRDDAYLSFKAEITSHNPMYIIEPGENFVSPPVFMGVINGDLDDAINEMHAHTRKSVLNNPNASSSINLIGCGMGAEHDMTVETSKAYIDQFKKMGGEVFIVDAGWVCPPDKETQWGDYNGLNVPHPERYPKGIQEIVDYCHEKGLKFGLWVDIESIGKFCEIFKAHPEWRAENVFGKQTDRFLDFTVPEAAKWAEDELARIITEYKLDLLRVDYNTSYRDYFQMRDTGFGIKECLSIRHFMAVEKMYGNLKKRFPNVIFENCAGGGGRTDLQFMRNFHHTWVSDNQCAPVSLTITNSATMALPPERVDRLFAGMGCHKYGSFDLQLRNIMLGHVSLNVISPKDALFNTNQLSFVNHCMNIYKGFIRPILPDSKIYHHTPEIKTDSKELYILEIGTPDKTKGAATVFRMSGGDTKTNKVILKGIDIGKTYKVTLDNSSSTFTATGRELLADGIPVNIPSSLSSELLLYEAV